MRRKERNDMSQIFIKDAQQIEGIRKANQAVANLLKRIKPYVKPGVTTKSLDELIHSWMLEEGLVSGSLNYGHPPFPGATCISINHVVCHGIPGDRALKEGDIVNIDICLSKDGYFGDSSQMFCVGEVSILAQRLVDVTYECMMLGIEVVKPGVPFREIGRVIEKHAHAHNYSVVQDFCGHGVGLSLHEAPQVLHYDSPMVRDIMAPGMIFTIEPMINVGKPGVKVLNDGWTAVTRDRSLTAQWEHAVLVTETGYEILSLPTE
ncbi:type I methionyl aminopeptidase [Ignatzschineria ureiclastica]|nr:type I methionyl aminopeptidase [Ignatzschineria ureiclastica]